MSADPDHTDSDEKSEVTSSPQGELKRGNSSDKWADPLISTLIPTYQRARLLERAIRSALGQTYPHLRVCVYDNASDDDTQDTVLKLSNADPRVRYFRHNTNIGSARNFIWAMERVETPFFSFLSDDDLLLPRLYETAMEGFRKYPEAMMSATASLQMDDAGNIQHAALLNWEPGLYEPPDGFLAMLDKTHPEWAGVVFRREVLQKAGGLDGETGGAFDVDYLLRVAARFPIVVSTELGAIFVMHAENASSNFTFCARRAGWLKIIKNQTSDGRIPVEVRDYARRVLTKRLTQTLFAVHGFGAITRGNWQDSRLAADALRRDYGLWIRAWVLSVATWACERLSLAHRAAFAFRAVTRLLTKLRKRPLQKRFGHYSAYLGNTLR